MPRVSDDVDLVEDDGGRVRPEAELLVRLGAHELRDVGLVVALLGGHRPDPQVRVRRRDVPHRVEIRARDRVVHFDVHDEVRFALELCQRDLLALERQRQVENRRGICRRPRDDHRGATGEQRAPVYPRRLEAGDRVHEGERGGGGEPHDFWLRCRFCACFSSACRVGPSCVRVRRTESVLARTLRPARRRAAACSLHLSAAA
mmetsp:Transcript_14021/g.41890  ORF Transcript_14021/g.41890 Transcript_14021/m.41890 type:complete len:203 (+) Transcript_14021:351-959(+)